MKSDTNKANEAGDSFFISEADLKRIEKFLKSKKGQREMTKALEGMKPKSQFEVWAENHKQAEWWAKIKNTPFTI